MSPLPIDSPPQNGGPFTSGLLGVFFGYFGTPVRRFLARIGSIAFLCWLCIRHGASLRHYQLGVLYEQTRLQVRFTAIDALPLVFLTSILLGGITLIQVFGQMSAFGAERYLSQLLASLVVRELGPLLVGIIIAGRSGTAIAAEMASIRLSGEVDALGALGINPVHYLLIPRILGGIISTFCLIMVFDAVALLGGFLLAWSRLPILPGVFLDALGEAIGIREFVATLSKAFVFGMLIPLICASTGLRVKKSSTEIPQAVTAAAVSSLVAIFLAGAFISVLIYA